MVKPSDFPHRYTLWHPRFSVCAKRCIWDKVARREIDECSSIRLFENCFRDAVRFAHDNATAAIGGLASPGVGTSASADPGVSCTGHDLTQRNAACFGVPFL